MSQSRFLAIFLIVLFVITTPMNTFAEDKTDANPDKITIGITHCDSIDRYITSVKQAGAIPYVMPLVKNTMEARKALANIDALIISGGSAIAPELYGAEETNKLEEVSPERDMSDILMLKVAMDLDMPVMGICRGMQVMNVVQGGTLYQDISAEYSGVINSVVHRDPKQEKWKIHNVEIKGGSLLYSIVNNFSLDVMSWHHQAIKKLGNSLTVTARADDGIIEAIEFDNQTFMIGVQFHPEKSVVANNGDQVEFFETLKKQGAEYRERLMKSFNESFMSTSFLCAYDNIKICWDGVKNVSGYAVYYKTADESNYKLYKRVTGTFVETGNLMDGIKYDFKIVPYIKRGSAFYEIPVTSKTSIYTLKKLEKPVLDKCSKKEVEITWKDINGQTGYQISRSTSSTGTNIIETWKTVSGTSKIVKLGETIGRPYYYKVRAYKTVAGQKIFGPWSDSVKHKREIAAPAQASVQLYGYDDVKMSWSKVENASGYAVYYKKGSSGQYKLFKRTSSTEAKKANFEDGVRYYFKVVPYYKAGNTYYNSSNSKIRKIYTLKKISTPEVTKRLARRVKVSWKDIKGQTGYQISRAKSKTGTNIVASFKSDSAQSKVVKRGSKSPRYYKVRAYKTVNGKKIFGPWSKAVKYPK